MNGLNDTYIESVIKKAISGKLATGQAAAKLGVTKQYVNKLKRAYAERGPSALRARQPREAAEMEDGPQRGRRPASVEA